MKCKLLLVGEAYGQSEEFFRHGFVSGSGRELAQMLAEAKILPPVGVIRPSEPEMIKYWHHVKENYGVHITNVFDEFPNDGHGNRIDSENYFFTDKLNGDTKLISCPLKAGKYLKPEMVHHIVKLHNLIAELRPNLVICLGNIAAMAVLNEVGIKSIRGTFKWCQFVPKIKCLATYHPANVLREMRSRPIVVGDFLKCADQINFPEIRRTERWILLRPSHDEMREWFAQPHDSLTVDIESGRALYTREELKKMSPKMRTILAQTISMIGFARDRHQAMVVPFMTRQNADLNYWPNCREEALAWEIIQTALNSPVKKIFQNGMYDIQILLTYMITVYNATEDTMLLHHSLFPEMEKKLGFLGSVYANERSWKNIYGMGEQLKKDD